MIKDAVTSKKSALIKFGPYLVVGAGAFGIGFACCYFSGANSETANRKTQITAGVDRGVANVSVNETAQGRGRSVSPELSWSGTGMKSTETFEVSSPEWVVEWEASPGSHSGNFILTVHQADAPMQLHDTAANEIVNETKKGRTTIRGNGRFFLKAIATCQWSASVTE